MAEVSTAVSLESIRDAAALIEGVAVRTPLKETPQLSRELGVRVLLKCENLQPVGAFKLRGAYTAIARLPKDVRSRGVITYSSGNHGLAVTYSADLLGIKAVIVMPETAPRIKVEGVKKRGGEVVLAGTTSVHRKKKAEEIVAEQGYVMIPPFEHADVIAGQGTCGLEILDQLPEVATILVPVGGGGLLAGIATAIAALKPSVRVIGVEPAGAAKLAAALAANRPVTLDKTGSIADGLLPLTIGTLPFAQMRDQVHESVQVTDDDIVKAMKYIHQDIHMRVEPSGAATTAALIARLIPDLEGPVVAVVSGGNVDAELFGRLVP
ncbi:MAG TPA: threonine/serine dehydratase [Gemmatimonadales bacterium]|jgi:threonine dehydratase|nr:threonine/serine dehydratase [Gemmatimonadales bacterium]